jgi:hypothetical protein
MLTTSFVDPQSQPYGFMTASRTYALAIYTNARHWQLLLRRSMVSCDLVGLVVAKNELSL